MRRSDASMSNISKMAVKVLEAAVAGFFIFVAAIVLILDRELHRMNQRRHR